MECLGEWYVLCRNHRVQYLGENATLLLKVVDLYFNTVDGEKRGREGERNMGLFAYMLTVPQKRSSTLVADHKATLALMWPLSTNGRFPSALSRLIMIC